MNLLCLFAAWSGFGAWMFKCLGRTPKQCLQCIVGRYVGLLLVLIAITVFVPK